MLGRGTGSSGEDQAYLESTCEGYETLGPFKWVGKAQALSCKALPTKVPNFGTEMTVMILEVALVLGVKVLWQLRGREGLGGGVEGVRGSGGV